MTHSNLNSLQPQSSSQARATTSSDNSRTPSTSRNRSQSYSSRVADLDSGDGGSASNNYYANAYSYHMNGIIGTAPPGTMYVRALYDYEADDRTSLSFHEGDVIQVITQLESGWWDGVINGVRGWFPSNYCQIITDPDELPEVEGDEVCDQVDDNPDDDNGYSEHYDDGDELEQDDLHGLPLEGTNNPTKSGPDFWIPQATSDGRLYYFNTATGESSMELPLESPTSANESGPRDRLNVNMPHRTRPPAEMMAGGLNQDEDEESGVNSASEMEGEALLLANGRVSYYHSLCSP